MRSRSGHCVTQASSAAESPAGCVVTGSVEAGCDVAGPVVAGSVATVLLPGVLLAGVLLAGVMAPVSSVAGPLEVAVHAARSMGSVSITSRAGVERGIRQPV